MKDSLRIFEIKSKYVNYLSEYQKHIFAHNGDKEKRKYIGIVLKINGFNYFAPLSSYKERK